MRKGIVAAFEGTGRPISIEVHDVRAVEPGEVLVKNLYTTICGSDIHTYCGVRKEACPTVLGHEIVGRIEEIGNAHPGKDDAGNVLQIGDIVTWSIFSSDPDSTMSLQGMPQKAKGLFKYGHAQIAGEEVFHGGLAEYCILKKGTSILKIPADVPIPVAATINCAIATVAGALRLAGTIERRTVLVTGMGLLGIVCAAMCKEMGAARVIAADIDQNRLRSAIRFGADETIDLNDVTNLPSVANADIAIDMSGAPDAMEYGLNKLTIGGVAVWVVQYLIQEKFR